LSVYVEDATDIRLAESSVRRGTWKRLAQNRSVQIGGAIVAIVVIVAVCAPLIAPYGPNDQHASGLGPLGQPVGPSWAFPLGTDNLGRDVLSRLLYGARVSLLVACLASGLAMTVGVAVGALAGYAGGWIEMVLMRVTDTMMAFPPLLFAVALATALGPGLTTVVIAIGFAFWTPMARVVRGEVLSLREHQYVEAAQASGAGRFRVLWEHILPHTVPVVVVYTTLGIGTAVLFEAGLSFLGAGIQPPTASWGSMIEQGQQYFLTANWLVLYPGLAIVITVVGFNVLGDGLRKALDPRGQLVAHRKERRRWKKS
jgi:peptide/nickel transport system permease protein